VSLARYVAYPLDCVLLALAIRVLVWSGHTAIVCDRYVFDKLVNLPDPAGRFGRWLHRVTPRPDRAFFLDAAPAEARRRRPEHAPEYYETKHTGYKRLADAELDLTRLSGMTIDETQARIESMLAETVPSLGRATAPAL
jgi:hypothetical protein